MSAGGAGSETDAPAGDNSDATIVKGLIVSPDLGNGVKCYDADVCAVAVGGCCFKAFRHGRCGFAVRLQSQRARQGRRHEHDIDGVFGGVRFDDSS